MMNRPITVHDLWLHSPQSFVFVRTRDGHVREYVNETPDLRDKVVENIKATSYSMYKSVLEVRVKED